MSRERFAALALALCAGAASVLGFAPFGLPAVPVAALALLFLLLLGAPTPRRAAAIGFAFGLGMYGAGVSWVYVALAGFGEMAPPLAAIATAIFVAYVALWPALAGWLAARLVAAHDPARLVVAAAAWPLGEWLRGWLFTGFPWLAVGYAQVPASPLAGYAPVGGVYLVSLASTLVAACLAAIVAAVVPREWRPRAFATPVVVAALLLIAGGALLRVEWTRERGEPLAVSLLQGNVSEEQKFDPGFRDETFRLYAALVERSRGRLVVLPESAYPMFAQQVPPEVFEALRKTATARHGLVLVGLFTAEPPLPGAREPRYYNTVAALGPDAVSLYRKRHLVPFGESIPFKSVLGPLIDSVLAIPLADQTPGDANQPPFAVAGHRIAVNICYEDAFGSELIGAAHAADILVNVTNDAWYGRSVAAWQHNQIAATRALELGRPMLRATNTGITSALDVHGREIGALPWFTRGVLEVTLRGRAGETPYAMTGDALAMALCVLVVVAAALVARRRARRSVA